MRQEMVIKKKCLLIITYRQDKKKKQRCRPDFLITENYTKTRGGCELYRTTKNMAKLQGIFEKSE